MWRFAARFQKLQEIICGDFAALSWRLFIQDGRYDLLYLASPASSSAKRRG
jgi:hypothetical protein